MKTLKIYKYIYIAAYLSIIGIAVYRIMEKVLGKDEHKCKCCKQKPLFESGETNASKYASNIAEWDRLMALHGGYDQKTLDCFVGQPTLGKDFWESQLNNSPAESAKEVTLARHKELSDIMRKYAAEAEAQHDAKEKAKELGF